MKSALLFGAAHAALQPENRENPIVTVIALLQDLKLKSENGMAEEAAMWEKYETFCKTTLSEKEYAMRTAEEMIDGYQAEIEQCKADIIAATGVINKESQLVADYTGDIAAATKVREMENVKYVKEHQDYKDSIYACNGAIEALNAVPQQVNAAKPTPVFLQTLQKPTLVSQDRWDSIISLVSQPAEPTYAVEASSGTVVNLLSNLKAEFTEELTELDKKETNAAHAFNQMELTLRNEINNKNELIEVKKAENGKSATQQGEAEKNLADTQAVLAQDTDYYNELSATYETKTQQYHQRTANRKAEHEAIVEAIGVLSSDEVSKAGAAQRYGASFLQMKSTTSLSPSQAKLLDFIRDRASTLNSNVLAQVAAAAAADPFGKVRTLIKDLLVRLQEQAEADMTKKQYCDKEMTANKAARKKLTSHKNALEADQESLEAKIESLNTAIEALTTEINDLDRSVEQATSLRNEEHAENMKTIDESTAAQNAVTRALGMLNEMYAKIGTPAAFLQAKVRVSQPAVFGNEGYKGMTGSATGVIGLLELIASDFATLVSETKAEEEDASNRFEDFMRKAEKNRAIKAQDKENKHSLLGQAQSELVNVEEDLKYVNGELGVKNQQWEDLQPVCVYTGVSYEQRSSKMQEEIKSLQEALEILSNMS